MHKNMTFTKDSHTGSLQMLKKNKAAFTAAVFLKGSSSDE